MGELHRVSTLGIKFITTMKYHYRSVRVLYPKLLIYLSSTLPVNRKNEAIKKIQNCRNKRYPIVVIKKLSESVFKLVARLSFRIAN